MLRPHDTHPSERRELAHLARRGAVFAALSRNEMDRLDDLAEWSERKGYSAAAETYRGLLAELSRMTWTPTRAVGQTAANADDAITECSM